MKVLLAGASDVIGLPLLRRLLAAGHDVTATDRSERAGDVLRKAGAAPVRVDALDRDGLLRSGDPTGRHLLQEGSSDDAQSDPTPVRTMT